MLDPFLYVSCNSCGEAEGQPQDQQRWHFSLFRFCEGSGLFVCDTCGSGDTVQEISEREDA